MIATKKKICMVGDFAVGKTSLTQQFVNQVFSDNYLTTIGVKIDTKIVKINDQQECKLVVWDVAGRDSLTPLQTNYLVGAAGFILVIDGTRRESIDSAKSFLGLVQQKLSDKPFLVLVNKADKQEEWKLTDQDKTNFNQDGWDWMNSSAKTGENVDRAFTRIVEKMTVKQS